jgi:hypothetical protein
MHVRVGDRALEPERMMPRADPPVSTPRIDAGAGRVFMIEFAESWRQSDAVTVELGADLVDGVASPASRIEFVPSTYWFRGMMP